PAKRSPIAATPAKPAPPVAVDKPAALPAEPAPQKEAPPVKAAAKAAGSGKLDLDIPPARILEAPAQSAGRVQKVERTRNAEDRAESEFRRGATLLNQGRIGEADETFNAALSLSPSHEAARQALIALYLERRRIDEARRLLQEGLAINPGNIQFAMVLARIQTERREYAAALDVLNGE